MMVKRLPEMAPVATVTDSETGEVSKLVDVLDKGFPYDDGDNSIDDAAFMYTKKPVPAGGLLVGKLNGENITTTELKALV